MDSLERASVLDAAAGAASAALAPLGRGRLREVLSGQTLGHALHPMLTDLPIGFWTSSFVLDIVGGRAGRAASQRFIGLGLVTVPITAWTGWSDWVVATQQPSPTNEQHARVVGRVGITHAALNGSAALAYTISYFARRRNRYAWGVVYGLLGASFATLAGLLGGHLVLRLGVGGGDPHSSAVGEVLSGV